MAGISSSRETARIAELQAAIEKYSPGKTIRSKEKRLRYPPKKTRIGVFGAPGVGKSALINSLLYVTGEMWNEEAAEGYAEQQSTTMMRDAYDLTDHLVVCDNRGMTEFSKKFMGEVEYQIGGARRDGEHVVWDKTTVERLNAYLTSMWTSKSVNKLSEIHCAVIVVSGANLLVKPSDLAKLAGTIQKMTGVPPVFILTHKKSESDSVSHFKAGLQKLEVQYVNEIENYTKKDHFYDREKHLELLEVLSLCTLVADRALQHAESQGSACILL